MFAAKYFSQMYWSQKPPDGYWPHRDPSPRFPELLAQAGIPTVTFASTRWLINEFGAVKGFTEESVVSRLFVDARVLSIFEGAEETLALKVIARSLLEDALGAAKA